MAAQARRRVAEQLSEVDLRSTPALSAALLQDTVDQFEKVIDLERSLLCKSISKLEHDLTETETQIGLKEEELMMWQGRLQQIQQDNELKLRLAKVRVDSTRYRHKSESRHTASVRRASPLGLIAEGNEDSSGNEHVEDDDDEEGSYVSPHVEGRGTGVADPKRTQLLATAESINALAGVVARELAVLRAQWQELMVGTKTLASPQHPHLGAPERAERGDTGTVPRYTETSHADHWLRYEDGRELLSASRLGGTAAHGPKAGLQTGAAPGVHGGAGAVAGSLAQRTPARAAALKGGMAASLWHGPSHQGAMQQGSLSQGVVPTSSAPQICAQLGPRASASWHSTRPGAVASSAAGAKPPATPPAWAQPQRVPARSANPC